MPEEVYPAEGNRDPETWCTTTGDGSEVFWSYHEGDWYTKDVNHIMAADPEAGKELSDSLAAGSLLPAVPSARGRSQRVPGLLPCPWQVKRKRERKGICRQREGQGSPSASPSPLDTLSWLRRRRAKDHNDREILPTPHASFAEAKITTSGDAPNGIPWDEEAAHVVMPGGGAGDGLVLVRADVP